VASGDASETERRERRGRGKQDLRATESRRSDESRKAFSGYILAWMNLGHSAACGNQPIFAEILKVDSRISHPFIPGKNFFILVPEILTVWSTEII
jgi:hypothetical protein